MFVQPGAKIHNAYYCEQGLLVAIHRISNNDLVFQQDGAPCMPAVYTVLSFYLRSNVPEFIVTSRHRKKG